MATYLWPGDTGWPTVEDGDEPLDAVDPDAEIDLDALALHAPPPHLYDELSDVEQRVLDARFGLHGERVRSMKELHTELGLTHRELREALGDALGKLRDQLT